MDCEARKLTGRCSSGAERGRGVKFHAVSTGSSPWATALCGARPGRLSAGWSEHLGDAVTCPRCTRKLERAR